MNQELPDVQAGFRKGRGNRNQIANICWIIEKAKEFQKNIYFFCSSIYSGIYEVNTKVTSASLIILKSLTVWITTNYGKFLKRWEYQTTLYASWEICMQVKKQQLELDKE